MNTLNAGSPHKPRRCIASSFEYASRCQTPRQLHIPSDICACFLELIVPSVPHAGVDDMAGSDTLRLVDDQTFEMLDRYSLEPMELGISASSMSFVDDDSTYYVVGTAFTEPDEAESKKVRFTRT